MGKRKNKAEVQAVTKIVLYARVSTDKQADQGHSIEAQLESLQDYARALKYEIVAVETDAASASSLDRPGLQRALARLDAGEAEGLLVMKLDRLTRSVRDLLELVDGGYAFISVSESLDTRSAIGRMLLKILTSVSEWEREAIGERTSTVMQHMRDQGLFTGGWPPFGYRVEDGRLVEDPREQAVIAEVRRLRASGMSLRRIAFLIGVQRGEKIFDAKQIQRML
jgi:site-specific DNA recombinase